MEFERGEMSGGRLVTRYRSSGSRRFTIACGVWLAAAAGVKWRWFIVAGRADDTPWLAPRSASHARTPRSATTFTTTRRFVRLLWCPEGRFVWRTRDGGGVGGATTSAVLQMYSSWPNVYVLNHCSRTNRELATLLRGVVHVSGVRRVNQVNARRARLVLGSLERSLDVGSCGQPVFGSWPYYPATGLRPTTAHLVYAEPLSDRSWHLSCRFAPVGPVHIRIL